MIWARNIGAVAITPAWCQSRWTSEFYKERFNSLGTSYCHYRLNEAKTEALWMTKMRLEVSFSVATAVYPYGRHCKPPQSGGRWQRLSCGLQ